jgi:prophage antirepressor-like protein
MAIKTEIWNDHEIRFIEKEPGEWWAVAKDVAEALAYKDTTNAIKLHCRWVAKHHLPHPQNPDKTIEVNTIPIRDIYRLISRSEMPEAEAFQDWLYDVAEMLRQASGLEAYQAFRMLDKDYQKTAMSRLQEGLGEATKRDYIKANTIADKAVSTLYGLPKMVKKGDMPPEMLADRQPILADTVNLIVMNRKFDLGLSVSRTVYGKYATQ